MTNPELTTEPCFALAATLAGALALLRARADWETDDGIQHVDRLLQAAIRQTQALTVAIDEYTTAVAAG